jgi:hypothetical protein
MTKAESFLANRKKHREQQETWRTPTIVLSCVRIHLDANRTSPNDVIIVYHSWSLCKKAIDGRIFFYFFTFFSTDGILEESATLMAG